MNSKYFLSREKKIALAKNYIALSYLNKIDLNFTKDEKNKLKENINNISPFKTLQGSTLPEYALNDFYKVYNDYIKFDEAVDQFEGDLDNVKKENDEDINIDEKTLKLFSFIFNTEKILSPLLHMAFYDMQYIFWETVVVGGYLFDKPLSGYLLRLSLNNKGEYDKKHPLIIEDEYITIILFGYNEFKNVINDFLNDDMVDIEEEVIFSGGDLLFAINKATLILKGNKKKDNSWNLTVKIKDIYDFTKIIKFGKYATLSNSKGKSILASALNNFAAVSSAYGVIRPFAFIIKASNSDYKIEN